MCLTGRVSAAARKDLLELVDRLGAKGVHLYSLKENFDTSTPHGRMVLTILGAINEFERANMLERQREGVAIAKREAKYKGRKKTEIDDVAGAYHAWVHGTRARQRFARENGISRPTLDRLLKEYEREVVAKTDN